MITTNPHQSGLVDALPYIDQGYDEPGVRDTVLGMIEEETRRYKPSKDYLQYLDQCNMHAFETDIMKTEMERIEAQKPMELLSMKRYELPDPAPNRLKELSSWTECVQNSFSQLEHQRVRIANLELMQSYGTEAWKQYNKTLDQAVQQAQKRIQAIRRQNQEINYARKKSQLDAGEKLRHLEINWVGLVSKSYDLEQACMQLHTELSTAGISASSSSLSENTTDAGKTGRRLSDADDGQASKRQRLEESAVDDEEEKNESEQASKETNAADADDNCTQSTHQPEAQSIEEEAVTSTSPEDISTTDQTIDQSATNSS